MGNWAQIRGSRRSPSNWAQIRVKELATGDVYSAVERGGVGVWTKCDWDIDDEERHHSVHPNASRLWVEHPDGRETEGSHGHPRKFYCTRHAWRLYGRVTEDLDIPTWDCYSCNNELNQGRPFKALPDSRRALTLECGPCWLRRWNGKPPINERPDDAPGLEPNR